MIRKADGAGFESAFSECIGKYHYTLRLPTLHTGYSGMTQPADFVVVGCAFNYVELKETASDAFSVSGMDQLQEVRDFIAAKGNCQLDKALREGNYYLIVHFLNAKTYKVLSSLQILQFAIARKTLKSNSDVLTFDNLDELCRRIAV